MQFDFRYSHAPFSAFLFVLLLFASCISGGDGDHIKVQPRTDLSHHLTGPDSLKSVELEQYFNKLYSRGGFNGNVLVARGGKILLEGCYGFADHQSNTELNTKTSFQLASVTKPFTAAGILILKEKELISLDDTVQKFIPAFPYPGITVRLLLGHRSGLFNYTYFCDNYIHDKATPIDNNLVIRMMNVFKPLPYYPPDKQFNYCNTGYVILASIIERVAKMPYGEFLTKEIFNPLEMKNTYVVTREDGLLPSFAVGYRGAWRKVPRTFLDGVVGDKGIYSTVRDLYKFDQALYTGRILSRQTLMEAFEPYGKPASHKRNYGYGWRTDLLPDSTKVIYHTGWWEGFQTLLLRVEKDTTSVIVLKNRKSGHIDRLGILKLLYPGSFPDQDDKSNGSEEDEETSYRK